MSDLHDVWPEKHSQPARARPTRLDLTRLYDATAWYWDSLPHRITYGRAYRELFKRLVRDGWLSGIEYRARVLECGIGAGLMADALLATLSTKPEICGIDISVKLLRRARGRLMRRGSALQIVPGDVHSLPFRNGEMKLVVSALMLEHAPVPLLALREMTRVADRGAPLIIVATRPDAPSHLFRLAYRYKPWPPQRLVHWMREAGVIDIQSYSLSGIARLFGTAYVGRNGKSDGHSNASRFRWRPALL